MTHGDIQPQTIFVTVQGGIKLVDISYMGLTGTGYYRMYMNSQSRSALSPQLLSSLKRRDSKPIHDIEKSDIFALGITLLCALTNSAIEKFYFYEQCSVNYDLLSKELIDLLELGFSKLLVGCIGNMVQEKEEARPTIKDIHAFINAHSEN